MDLEGEVGRLKKAVLEGGGGGGGGRRLLTKRTRLRGVEYGSDELMGSLSEEDEGEGEGRHNISAYRRSRIADS